VLHRADVRAELPFEKGRFDRAWADHVGADALAPSSAVHVRTNERRAAFVALYAEYIGIPFCQAPEPLTMIEPPSFISGRAFCTVKKTPRAFTPKVLS